MGRLMSTDDPEGERIAKVLSRAGIASRRDAERMILDGRVTVNGRVAASPAMNVTEGDRLAVDGVRVAPPEPTRLWLYHKPAGVITTTADEEGRETVFEGLPAEMPRVMAVGRLDLTSEGLLLLTNDGELKRQLELPATGWLRRYRVRINGTVSEAQLDRLRAGVTVEEVDYAPMEVQFDRQQGANAWLTVGLREGKNREIRRVMDYLGVAVNRLIRVSYGPFQLGEIAPGEVREVQARALRAGLGLPAEPEEQRLTRRVRGAAPVKVKPVRTGPVMRSTKGGPRPGEGGPRPPAVREDTAPAGGEPRSAGAKSPGAAGVRQGKAAPGGTAGKPRPGKPARAGHVSDRPGWSAEKAAAVAAAREGGDRKPRSAGAKSHAPGAAGARPGKAAPGGTAGKPRAGKPARAGHVSDRPGWSAEKAAAVAAAREGGERKPRSVGAKSHAPGAAGVRQGKAAPGGAAGKPRAGKPARAGHVSDRPGWSAEKAAAVAAAREGAERKPRSAGFKSHAAAGGGKPASPGRSTGSRSHRAADSAEGMAEGRAGRPPARGGPGKPGAFKGRSGAPAGAGAAVRDRKGAAGPGDRPRPPRAEAGTVNADVPRKPRHKAGGAGSPARTGGPGGAPGRTGPAKSAGKGPAKGRPKGPSGRGPGGGGPRRG
jgi:23S rRNA pseudouridine2605 synthase